MVTSIDTSNKLKQQVARITLGWITGGTNNPRSDKAAFFFFTVVFLSYFSDGLFQWALMVFSSGEGSILNQKGRPPRDALLMITTLNTELN